MPDPNTVSPETSSIIANGQESRPNFVSSSDNPDQPAAPDIQGGPQGPATAPSLGAPAAAAPQAPKPDSAAVATNARHSALGRLVDSLFGTHTEYSVDPQSGKTVAVPVQRKPGEFFSHIVAGALIGGAAAEAQKSQGLVGGMTTGGAASIQNDRNQDQQRLGRARQEFSNEQQADKSAEQKKWQEYQIAQANINNLRLDSEMNLHTQEFIQQQNEHNQAFQSQLEAIGAQKIPYLIGDKNMNGVAGNGKALMGHGVDNLKAPPGYHTVHTQTVDYSGLSLKDGKWTDSDGKPVNLEDRTTHTVYAIPDNFWNKPVTIKIGELNKIAGGKIIDGKDDAEVSLTAGGLMGLKAKAGEQALEKSKVDVEFMKARLEAAQANKQIALAGKQINAEQFKAFQQLHQNVADSINNLRTRIKDVEASYGDTSGLQAQLAELEDEETEMRNQLLDMAKVKRTPSAKPKPTNSADLPADKFQVVLQHVQSLPPDKQGAEIDSAASLSANDKAKLKQAISAASNARKADAQAQNESYMDSQPFTGGL